MSNNLYRWQQLAAALELAEFFTHCAAAAARFRHGRNEEDDKDIQRVLAISSQIFDLKMFFITSFMKRASATGKIVLIFSLGKLD